MPVPVSIQKQIRSELEERKRNPYKKVSNDFINAAIKKNNIVCLKIIFYIATLLEEQDYMTVDERSLITLELNTKKLLEVTALRLQYIHKNLKSMQETSIKFLNEKKETLEGMSLLPYFNIEYGREYTTIKIFRRIADMFIDVKKCYTFINCDSLQKFKCKHSLKLLPLLKQMNGYSDDCAPTKTMNIDELNEFFGTNYKTLKDIKTRILAVVKDELDRKSQLSFTYQNVALPLYKFGRPYNLAVEIILQKKDSMPLF